MSSFVTVQYAIYRPGMRMVVNISPVLRFADQRPDKETVIGIMV